jgi:DNA polymerase delta subunit 1
LELTQKLIEDKYNKANGYQIDSQVFYGDTDSVMIRFGCNSIEEALVLGKEASAYVS